jgi:hypothetical protein
VGPCRWLEAARFIDLQGGIIYMPVREQSSDTGISLDHDSESGNIIDSHTPRNALCQRESSLRKPVSHGIRTQQAVVPSTLVCRATPYASERA